jgi:hypothetical protein
MADRTADKVFDEADVLIIVGRALGKTHEGVGKWVSTPTFATGVSEKTVRNRINDMGDAFDRLIGRISLEFSKRDTEFEQITKERYREKLAELRGKAVRVKEKALDHAIINDTDTDALSLGVKVADSLEDRDLGKATQVHKVNSDHRHILMFNPQPVRKLIAQEVDMDDSRKLLESLGDDVLEAEVIE